MGYGRPAIGRLGRARPTNGRLLSGPPHQRAAIPAHFFPPIQVPRKEFCIIKGKFWMFAKNPRKRPPDRWARRMGPRGDPPGQRARCLGRLQPTLPTGGLQPLPYITLPSPLPCPFYSQKIQKKRGRGRGSGEALSPRRL